MTDHIRGVDGVGTRAGLVGACGFDFKKRTGWVRERVRSMRLLCTFLIGKRGMT